MLYHPGSIAMDRRGQALSFYNFGYRLAHKVLWALFVFCAGNVSAAITVDSLVVTRSNCANDGTLTVYAQTTAPPMLYALVSGPVTRPFQSGNQFGGLPPGTYEVMVVNFSTDTVRRSVLIDGNYQFPDFAPTFSNPICAGDSSGTVIGKLLNGTGTPPYRWELTQNATGRLYVQGTDTFSNLLAGSYTLRVYDSCQSFTTRSLTLTNPSNSFTITGMSNDMVSCDTVRMLVRLTVPGMALAQPLTVRVQTAQGTYQHTVQGLNANDMYPEFTEIVPGVSYGDYINLSVTDACGTTLTKRDDITPFAFAVPTYVPVQQNCAINYSVRFGLTSGVVGPNQQVTNIHAPVTVIVSEVAGGLQVDSSVLTSTSGMLNYIQATQALVSGRSYRLRVTDTCGNTYTTTFTVPTAPARTISHRLANIHCRDSVSSYSVTVMSPPSPVTLRLLSGPATIQSSKPYFAYTDSILYNRDLSPTGSVSGPNGIFGSSFDIANLGAGKYVFQVSDSCGNVYVDSFTITPANLSSYSYTGGYTRGCPGQSRLNFTGGGNSLYVVNLNTNTTVYYSSYTSMLQNLDGGRYAIQIGRSPINNAIYINKGDKCHTVYDTIIIPTYQQPLISYETQVACNGQVYVILNPDTGRGLSPYRYELISGPATSPLQSSNIFQLTIPGSYTARIIDTCGNAQTYTFTMSTNSFPPIGVIGSSCAGSNAVLFLQPSSYTSNTWRRPNGTFFTGDSLRITPVTNTDLGTYTITQIVNINNCTDTLQTTYNLTGSTFNVITRSICTGQSVVFGGNTYSTTGIYRDTIPTTGCDSILELHLSVTPYLSGLQQQTICTGQSVTVGIHTYTQTGVYTDTLTTAGCDSIHILELTVNDYSRDSLALSICAGDSIAIGFTTYSQAGIYRDTLAGAGCGRILLIDLAVRDYKRETVTLSICAGESVTVGANIYNQAGLYPDTFAIAGCDSIRILELLVEDHKTDSVAQIICAGESITVGTNTYNQTGIYRDTFATATCDSIFILNLTVLPAKYDSLVRSVCTGQSVTVGNSTYNQSDIYRDTIPTSTCDSIVVLNLTVDTYIRHTIDTAICPSRTVTIGNNTYNAAGSYTDTFATASCDSIVILNLIFLPADTTFEDVSVCEQETYIWLGNPYTTAGNYARTFTGTNTCDSVVILRLRINPLPAITASADKEAIRIGEQVLLNVSPTGGFTFVWLPQAVLDNPLLPNPIATITQPTWFIVTATDTVTNCMNTDSVFVNVLSDGCDTTALFIPNAFTPGNDDNNEEFRIFWYCPFRLFNIKIFNRWGEKMFDSDNPDFRWNGTFKGVLQKPDVFVYVLTALTVNGEQLKYKGSITLIR